MARSTSKAKSTSPQRFESVLWQAADKLRGNLDAAEYKHVVLGLIFLKYISDTFEEKHRELITEQKETGASQTREVPRARVERVAQNDPSGRVATDRAG
jgi:type I restriction enzyme M protein